MPSKILNGVLRDQLLSTVSDEANTLQSHYYRPTYELIYIVKEKNHYFIQRKEFRILNFLMWLVFSSKFIIVQCARTTVLQNQISLPFFFIFVNFSIPCCLNNPPQLKNMVFLSVVSIFLIKLNLLSFAVKKTFLNYMYLEIKLTIQ